MNDPCEIKQDDTAALGVNFQFAQLLTLLQETRAPHTHLPRCYRPQKCLAQFLGLAGSQREWHWLDLSSRGEGCCNTCMRSGSVRSQVLALASSDEDACRLLIARLLTRVELCCGPSSCGQQRIHQLRSTMNFRGRAKGRSKERK